MLPDGLIVTSYPAYATILGLKLPVLTFPTSTVSRNNGTILGLGASAVLVQSVPVLGPSSPTLPLVEGRLIAGYTHTFTEATQPTSDELGRVRMDPEGVSFVSDQLGGAAFAAHQFTLALQAALYVTRRVSYQAVLGWRPTQGYRFREEQELCGVVATGCTTVDTVHDPQSYSVITQFATTVGVRVLDQLGVSFGYDNTTLQRGPDGRRRNILYSPAARFELALVFHIDELYQTASQPGLPCKPGSTC